MQSSAASRSGEMADALRSGRSGGDPVGVQISPSAPFTSRLVPEPASISLGNSLKVERLILDQVVGVRIPVPQPKQEALDRHG